MQDNTKSEKGVEVRVRPPTMFTGILGAENSKKPEIKNISQ